jgi:hypothetical protein
VNFHIGLFSFQAIRARSKLQLKTKKSNCLAILDFGSSFGSGRNRSEATNPRNSRARSKLQLKTKKSNCLAILDFGLSFGSGRNRSEATNPRNSRARSKLQLKSPSNSWHNNSISCAEVNQLYD